MDDLFAADHDRALGVLSSLPPEAPKPAAKWNTWSAPLRALPAIAADALAAGGELATSAWRTNRAMQQFGAREKDPERRAARAQAFNDLNGRNPVSDALRDVTEHYRPDPLTAGLAEQLFFEAPRLIGKALTYTAAAGPAGLALLAGDESMAATDALQRQGVDDETAARVGVLGGGVTALGVALPIAAPGSLLKTAGLYLAGGPGGFMAQQAASRQILAEAGYDRIAAQYDPLDPVGLAVSALVPLPFIGMAMRGARAPKVAPPELVDATMVQNLSLRQDVRDATPVSAAVAAIRTREIDAARGVTVETLQAADGLREFVAGPGLDQRDNKSRFQFGEVTPDVRERILADTGIDVPVGAVQQLRADVVRHAQKGHPDLTPDDWAALGWLGENFNRAVLLKEHPNDKGPRMALAAIDPATGYAYVAEFLSGAKKGDRLSVATFFKDHPNTVESWLRTNRRGGDEGGGGGTPDDPVLPRGPQDLTSETASGAPQGGIVGQAADRPATPGTPEARAERAAQDVRTRLQAVEQAAPDMVVRVDDSGHGVTLAEEMQRVRQEAGKGTADELGAGDADLLRAAAACELRGGSGG